MRLNLLLGIVGIVAPSAVLALPPCLPRAVEYEAPFSVVPRDHFRIEAVVDSSARGGAETLPSPRGDALLTYLVKPDNSKPGPRDTVVEITRKHDPKLHWRIEAVDALDVPIFIWVNEELLRVEVWWGRIRSTDMIFRITDGVLIYARDAEYAYDTEPCAREPN